jgi:hypothetical protein
MREIIIKEGKFSIPEEYQDLKVIRKRHIVMPWCSISERLTKDNFQSVITQYMRIKGKDKPYIEEGFLEINGERFKVIEEKKEEQGAFE